MTRYIITELQHVIACRAVEADNAEAALALFMDGQGAECGRDGDVIDSTLETITPDSEFSDLDKAFL